MCQQPLEHRNVKIRPCLRQQSHDEGDEWYIAARHPLTGLELDEDDCLRYLTKEDAIAAVDYLLDEQEHAPWAAEKAT